MEARPVLSQGLGIHVGVTELFLLEARLVLSQGLGIHVGVTEFSFC